MSETETQEMRQARMGVEGENLRELRHLRAVNADLLAALRAAQMDMQSMCAIKPDWHRARFTLEAINAAIAKAEGRA